MEHAATGYLGSRHNSGAHYPSFAVTTYEQVSIRLSELARLSAPLAHAFGDAGFSLYAVGGAIRDAALDQAPGDDFEIDYTTNARPDDIARLVSPLCTSLWEQGRAFGTIGGILRESAIKVEVTTFRSEAYVDHSRKPAVEWGDSLEVDLSRRDFTMNALALEVLRDARGHGPDAPLDIGLANPNLQVFLPSGRHRFCTLRRRHLHPRDFPILLSHTL